MNQNEQEQRLNTEQLQHEDIIVVDGVVGSAVKDYGGDGGFAFWDHAYSTYSWRSLPRIDAYTDATHEQKVELLIRLFPWGRVEHVHVFGEFLIFQSRKADEEIRFHAYRDYRAMGRSFPTLDYAIVGAIAIKYDGLNTQAATYFARAVQM